MLVIYDKNTGKVLTNTGTAPHWPEGPPDEVVDQLLETMELSREQVGFIRLHDESDFETVNRVGQYETTVEDGQLVFGRQYVPFSFTASTTTIKAGDPESYSVVTYTQEDEVDITFLVNDVKYVVPMADHAASVEIVADEPGPIEVVVRGSSIIINAEA